MRARSVRNVIPISQVNRSQRSNSAACPLSLKLEVRTLRDNWNKQVQQRRTHIVMVLIIYFFLA